MALLTALADVRPAIRGIWSGRSVLVALLSLVLFDSSRADESNSFRNPAIKAVFVYNFTQFVRWPAAAFKNDHTPFVIGILGDDPFHQYLDQAVHDETIDQHPLVVQRYHRAEDIGACQLLFISDSMAAELPRVLALVRHRSVLTVAEIPDFCARGGMIQLATTNRKTRLLINLDAATGAHLVISSKLLRPAEIVRGE